MPVIKSVIRLNDLDTNFVDEMIETGSEVFGEDVPKTIKKHHGLYAVRSV
jgi:hypothetical protein